MRLSTKTKLKAATILSKGIIRARSVLGRPSEGIFRRKGINWWLDLGEGIDFSIFLLGAFEPSTRKFYADRILEGFTVLDIGANIGAHTLPFAFLVGGRGRVFSFEATDYAVKRLKKNLDLNPEIRERVKVVHCLLTDGSERFDGVAAIESRWPLDAATASRPSIHGGEAEVLGNARRGSLDQFLATEKLDRVDFIKLDVDGFEWTILQGAEVLFKNHRPPVLMELAPDYDPENFPNILEFFLSRNYQFFELFQSVPMPRKTASIVKKIPKNGSINVIAVPTAD